MRRAALWLFILLLAAGCSDGAVEVSGVGEYRDGDGLTVELAEDNYRIEVETSPASARRDFYIQLHSTEMGTYSGCVLAEYEDIARNYLEICRASNVCPPGEFEVFVYDPYGGNALRNVDWTVSFVPIDEE
ncbi:MAG: hypothetical protein OXH86_09830 [Acidimicrobiaceae bacterium]|nr:hypothetical protein [Acidimicrobiaceae bacterium]MDE0497642.1 hypothetical protein [Acidimicrobiaceae bacterium]